MAKPPHLGFSCSSAPLGRSFHGRGVPSFCLHRLRAAQQVVPQQGHDGGAIRGGARSRVPLSKEGAPRGFLEVPLLVRQNATIKNPVSAC